MADELEVRLKLGREDQERIAFLRRVLPMRKLSDMTTESIVRSAIRIAAQVNADWVTYGPAEGGGK